MEPYRVWKEETMARAKTKKVEPILIEDTGKIQYLIVPKGCAFPKLGLARYRDHLEPSYGDEKNTLNYYGWPSEEQAVVKLNSRINRTGIAVEDFFVATTEVVFPRSNELGEIAP